MSFSFTLFHYSPNYYEFLPPTFLSLSPFTLQAALQVPHPLAHFEQQSQVTSMEAYRLVANTNAFVLCSSLIVCKMDFFVFTTVRSPSPHFIHSFTNYGMSFPRVVCMTSIHSIEQGWFHCWEYDHLSTDRNEIRSRRVTFNSKPLWPGIRRLKIEKSRS